MLHMIDTQVDCRATVLQILEVPIVAIVKQVHVYML